MEQHSPEPGTPQTYAKAIWGMVTSFVFLAGATIMAAVADGRVTTQEWVAIFVAGFGGPVTGGVVAKVRNKPLRPRERVR